MTNYIQKKNNLRKRYESSGKINKNLEKQININSYYTKSTICYIKRQILIVYHLLDKSLESWWTISPNPSLRKRRPVEPAFKESDFRPIYRMMKSNLFEMFQGEVSRLSATLTEPEIIKEVRTLSRDICETSQNTRLRKKTISNE